MEKDVKNVAKNTYETIDSIEVEIDGGKANFSEKEQEKVLKKIDKELGDKKVDLDPEKFPHVIKEIIEKGNELGKDGARASAILSSFLTTIRHERGKEIWKETCEKLGLPKSNIWESWKFCPTYKTLSRDPTGFPDPAIGGLGFLSEHESHRYSPVGHQPQPYSPAARILKISYRINLKEIFRDVKGVIAKDSDDPIKPDPEKNPLDRDNLPFITDHLRGFKYVDRALRLQGREYLPAKKAIWYQTHSMMIRKQKIEQHDAILDCRFHIAFPFPSGSGKKNFIVYANKVFKELGGQEVVKPTSLHPEQLIGKTEKAGKKNPTYEEIRGHLDDDLVIMDEAIDLFRSSKEKISQTRSYLNEALDYYGQNRVTKRMTDIPKEKRLSYMPDCNVTIFIQPFQVDEEFALQGTLRRFLIPYSKFDPTIQIEGYSNFLEGKSDIEFAKAISSIQEEIRKTKKHQDQLNSDYIYVEEDAVNRLKELHLNLVLQGYAHSDKGKNFTRIIDYQLAELLLKFSAIQAIVSGHKKIKEEDIEKAFIDLSDILACTLEYIYRKVIGSLDYNDDWKGARKKDRKCLEWLRDKGATSKNKSDIKIHEYQKKVEEICGVGERQAERKVSKHEENSWILKKQIGQHDSRVWLEINTEGRQDRQGRHGVKTIRDKIKEKSPYFDLVKKYQNSEGCQGRQGRHGQSKGERDLPDVTPDTPDVPEKELGKIEKPIFEYLQSCDGNSVDLNTIHNMPIWDQLNEKPDKVEVSDAISSLLKKKDSIKKDSNSGYYYRSNSQPPEKDPKQSEETKKLGWGDVSFKEHEKSIKGEIND